MMQRFWIIGKKGILSKAFQRLFDRTSIPYEVSSQEECDITDYDKLEKAAKRCSHILNCSAYTAVDLAEKEREKAFAVNATGVENLAKIAQKRGIKLIHFSTDYVFDGNQGFPYKETDTTNPTNVYGKSKERGEILLQERLPHSLVIRTSWIFSRDGYHFVKAMVQAMKEKERIEVIEDQVSKPTYVEDLVVATMVILEKEGIYHFANQEEVSRYKYAQEIFSELQQQNVILKCREIVPISSKKFSAAAERPAYSALDTTKIEQILERPIRSHSHALREYLSFMIKQELISVS